MSEYTFNMAHVRIALAACCLVVGGLEPLSAQRADSVTLNIRVIDSAGSIVPTAQISLTRGGVTLRRTQTDSLGRVRLRIRRDTLPLTIAVRRIAFHPYEHDFDLPVDASVIVVNVVLADVVEQLDTVAVTDRQSIRRRSYFLDSTSIFSGGRTIIDGWDILRKLRPRIAYGIPAVCPGVQSVWINGTYIKPEFVAINDMIVLHEPVMSKRVTPHLAAKVLGDTDRSVVMSVMASIRPEHVAQMTYRDCSDTAIAGLHSTSALFVVLKKGIAFSPGRGTYVQTPRKDR